MQTIILKGNEYAGVDAVGLPIIGGGEALFHDVGDTTAVAEDVATGKYFYDALGRKTLGTGSGGPYIWVGDEAALWKTYPATKKYLKDTGYATWTPSTTGANIDPTFDLDRFAVDFVNYEYAVMWRLMFEPVYTASATNVAKIEKGIVMFTQFLFRTANSVANVQAENKNYNTIFAQSMTVGLSDYWNNNGNRTVQWNYNNGVYAYSWYQASISSSAADNPDVTLKSPIIGARCNASMFSTANAAAIDQDRSSYSLQCDVYRVKKNTSAASWITNKLLDIYNNGL